MNRNTKLRPDVANRQSATSRPDGSISPAAKAKRQQSDGVVVFDDRLMLYSKSRSISWAEERQMFLKGVREALKPQNVLEDHAAELITDQIMQIRMLDRFRVHVLERARGDALLNLLVGRLENAHGLVLAMLKGDQAAHAAIDNALSTFGIPEDAINAEAFMLAIDQIERLNALSAQAQIRIDLQLKQIERRRPLVVAEINALTQVSHEYDEEGVF